MLVDGEGVRDYFFLFQVWFVVLLFYFLIFGLVDIEFQLSIYWNIKFQEMFLECWKEIKMKDGGVGISCKDNLKGSRGNILCLVVYNVTKGA